MWEIGRAEDRGTDSFAVETSLRHGNFDHVTGAPIWDEAIPRKDLPPSLSLRSKPAFFGSLAWPWVTPEDPTAPLARLPARECFDRIHGLD